MTETWLNSSIFDFVLSMLYLDLIRRFNLTGLSRWDGTLTAVDMELAAASI